MTPRLKLMKRQKSLKTVVKKVNNRRMIDQWDGGCLEDASDWWNKLDQYL